MTDSMKSNITKLNNSNYANWKFKMELMLRSRGLWKKVILLKKPSAIIGTTGQVTNQTALDEWDEVDDEARGIMGLSVEDNQLAHIRSKKTAKETWDALKDYHEKSTLTNIVSVMRTICTLKLVEGGDAKAHIEQMQNLFTRLSDLGEQTLSDRWSAAMLLSSLPDSYDALITALENRSDNELTFALVQQKVIAEYERHSGNEHNSTDSVLKTVARVNACFFCGKTNHIKRNCDKYKAWLAKRNGSNGKKSEMGVRSYSEYVKFKQ